MEKDTNKVISPKKVQDGMTFEDVVTSLDEVISIDGYNYDSSDREVLTIGTGENVINIYYIKKNDLSYTVNYLEKDTDNVIHAAKVQGRMTFEQVVKSIDEIIEIDGYNYDSVDKDSLTIGTGENIINIYYTRRNDLTYKVNYLEKNTDKVLHLQKVQVGMAFEDVVNSIDEVITIDGYAFDSVDKDTLTISTGDNVINIYYTKVSGLSYKVNYLEKDTGKVLLPTKEQGNQTFEDVIMTAVEIVDITGYKYDSADRESLVITTGENVINLYYVKRNDLSYTVNYLEKDTDKVLHDAKIQGNMIFEDVIKSSDEVITIDGYVFDSTDKDSLTITVDENIINIYYTKRNDLSYTVNYLEKETNKVLHVAKLKNGMTFDTSIDVSKEIIAIDGYNYDSMDKTALTITTGVNELNIYYTKKNDLSYKVNYLEKNTNKVIRDSTIKGGMTFESIVDSSTEIVDIDGYNYDSIDKDSLTIGTGENIINIYYIKRNDLSYTVNYLEKDSNEVLHVAKLQNGMTFETVIDSSKEIVDIDGYNYDSVDKDSLVIGTGENVINIYYIKRSDLSFTVNYLEKSTNKVIAAAKVEGDQTFGTTILSVNHVIAINGYSYDSVSSESIVIGTGNNVINVYYTKVDGLSYTVNYLEKGTNKVIILPKTEGNQVFEKEIFTIDEVITIDGYNYDSSDKEVLTIGTGENVINLYYTRRTDLSYTVHYLENGTNKVLYNDKVQSNVAFETVINSEDEVIDIDGYNYYSADKISLVVGTGINELTIYYTKKTDLTYTVNYLEKGTNAVISNKKVQENVTFNTVIDSSKEVITIYGYDYDSVDKDTLVIGTSTNEINIYYTKKSSSVVVHYYEEGSTNKVSEDQVISGKVFDKYDTYEANNVDSKYELVKQPDNASGEMTENVIEVIYYYRKKATQVIVHYYEEGTTNKLSENVTIDGRIDDYYSTSAATDIPIKYELVAMPQNKEGYMTQNVIHVIYYYRVKDTTVTIKYINKTNGKELVASEQISGKVDQTYSTSSKLIDGYTLVGDSNNTNGTMTVDEIVVTYYYLQNTQATVQYIDKTNGNIIEQRTERGLVGDEFVTESKSFANYILVEEPINKTIKMAENEIILKYYYIHVAGGVIEKHIDVVSGQVLANEVHTGNEGDPYYIVSRTFDGYDLVEDRLPINSTGIMQVNSIEVTYYYIHRATIVAQYVDKATGEKLTEDVITECHESDPYSTENKSFDDYKLSEVPENASGFAGKGENKVIYYYAHVSAGVIENHYDIMSGKKIAEERRYDGYEGDPYETNSLSIQDYDIYTKPANASGTMNKSVIRVNYFYIKKSGVDVKYIDKFTGAEIAQSDVKNGHEGDSYTTDSKVIDGYDLVIIPANKDGKMASVRTTVVYEYLRPAKVVVNYYDSTTKQKIDSEEVINGYQGDSYTTVQKDIPYYVFENVSDNKAGTMEVIVVEENNSSIVTNTTYVNYYYRKMKFDFSIDKNVKNVLVNGVTRNVNSDIAKIEIEKNQLANTRIQVEYSIKVTNLGEIAGSATLFEEIPNNMLMQAINNSEWNVSDTVATLDTKQILPGESVEYKVVLDWICAENNFGTKSNVVKILNTSNDAGFVENDKTNNEDYADVVITLVTGREKDYVLPAGVILVVLIGMTSVIYSARKKE